LSGLEQNSRRNIMPDENQTSQNHMTADQTLLAGARKARFDDLPNYS
ncbi:unnamed protein product, partial [Rotaria magnacalcarata]